MKIFLAPMAGVTDLPFRLMVRKYCPIDLAYTEMVSAKAMHYNDKKTFDLLQTCKEDFPLGVQLFGHEPQIIAEAVDKICEMGIASEININMGCPAKKIVKNGDGAALMKDVKLASEIVEMAVKASNLPVNVKLRLGWETIDYNFPKAMENAGANSLIIHGRTALQEYRGTADWEEICKIAESVGIDVVGNGDVKSLQCIMQTLQGIMIGRAFMGNPALSDNPDCRLALEHLELMRKYKPDKHGVLESRKQMAWYFKNPKVRQEIFKANTYQEMEEICKRAVEMSRKELSIS